MKKTLSLGSTSPLGHSFGSAGQGAPPDQGTRAAFLVMMALMAAAMVYFLVVPFFF